MGYLLIGAINVLIGQLGLQPDDVVQVDQSVALQPPSVSLTQSCKITYKINILFRVNQII